MQAGEVAKMQAEKATKAAAFQNRKEDEDGYSKADEKKSKKFI